MAKSDSERLESRHLRELRKENVKLRRENQQLRKKIMQIEHRIVEQNELEALPPVEIKTKTKEVSCPHCGSHGISIMTLRGSDYFKCSECERKGKYSKKAV